MFVTTRRRDPTRRSSSRASMIPRPIAPWPPTPMDSATRPSWTSP